MFDKTYRQRLEADLAQWEADGVIAPAAAASIRNALPPLLAGINIAVVVGIVGGLLIAAAFLAFVAAHWTEIARLLRFAILIAGMVVAGGLGAWFAATGRTVLADLCASIGAIIFGAGIALVGQMYHLGDDFAGGMLLWSIGAFAAALLTGSRGALAVGLVGRLHLDLHADLRHAGRPASSVRGGLARSPPGSPSRGIRASRPISSRLPCCRGGSRRRFASTSMRRQPSLRARQRRGPAVRRRARDRGCAVAEGAAARERSVDLRRVFAGRRRVPGGDDGRRHHPLPDRHGVGPAAVGDPVRGRRV